MRRALALAALVAAVGLSGPAVGATGTGTSRSARPSGSITVLAASSLTGAFTRIGKDFERRSPGTSVMFSFGSSATLATQAQQGAPADVLASADRASTGRLVTAGDTAGAARVFARNRLAIAVARGNPKRIRRLADTLKSGVTLVLCAPEVPCGKYARQAYRKARLRVPNGPTAENAEATLTKVSLGEADAAIVYVTDVESARRSVDGVPIPDAQNVTATYPIVALKDAGNPELARAFVRYVTGRAGRRTLARFGFLEP